MNRPLLNGWEIALVLACACVWAVALWLSHAEQAVQTFSL